MMQVLRSLNPLPYIQGSRLASFRGILVIVFVLLGVVSGEMRFHGKQGDALGL